MHKAESKRILALVSDLMFTVKINDAAKRNGLAVDYVTQGADLIDKAKQMPALIIVDLNIGSAKPVELIKKLKSDDELKNISVLSYVSHVEGELKKEAHKAGCDQVLARSAFSQNLVQILKRHAGTS